MPSDEQASRAEIERCLEQVRAGGGQPALERLWMLTYERMLDHLRRVLPRYPKLRGRMDAEDLVTRELMRRLRTMVLSQLPQTAEDLFRLTAVNIRWEILSLLKKHEKSPVALPDDVSGEAEDGEDDEKRLRTLEAIAGLPEGERAVVELLCFEGLTQEEAGRKLGIGKEAVRKRWQNARKHLKDELQRWADLFEEEAETDA